MTLRLRSLVARGFASVHVIQRYCAMLVWLAFVAVAAAAWPLLAGELAHGSSLLDGAKGLWRETFFVCVCFFRRFDTTSSIPFFLPPQSCRRCCLFWSSASHVLRALFGGACDQGH